MSHKPAGGLKSKQTVHRPLSKPEPKPHSINPEAVGQIGISTFLGREALRDGKGYATPIGPSDNVAAVGVGGVAHSHEIRLARNSWVS
jgi:hypothetical protein